MGLISKLLNKSSEDTNEFKSKLKAAQEDERIRRIVEERSKSANQRELERYMKDQQEDHYKKALEKIRDKRNSEMWKSTEHGILKKDKSILTDDRPILKEKNIFKCDNSNIFMNTSSLLSSKKSKGRTSLFGL